MSIFKDLTDGVESRYQGLLKFLLLITTCFLLTAIMTSMVSQLSDSRTFKAGEVAKYSVISPRDFLVEDKGASDAHRAASASNVNRVFTIDDRPENFVAYRIGDLFKAIKIGKAKKTDDGNHYELTDEQREQFERLLAVDLVGKEWAPLLEEKNWENIGSTIVEVVEPIQRRGIIAKKNRLQAALAESGATLRRQSSGAEEALYSAGSILDVAEAERELNYNLRKAGLTGQDPYPRMIRKISLSYLQPNVVYDSQITEQRMKKASDEVSSIFYKIRRGEIIVRAGSIITPSQEKKLTRLAEMQQGAPVARTSGGYILLSALILLMMYVFTVHLWPNFRPNNRDLLLLSLTLVGSFLLLKADVLVGESLNFRFPDFDSRTFIMATPLAVGGILLQVTLGAPSVFFFTLSFGLLAGVFLENSWLLLLMIVIGNIVGALGVKQCSRRTAFLLAGAKVALWNSLLVLCFMVLSPELSQGTGAFFILCASLGGLLSGIIGAGVAPVAEYIGRYITDIKLLELASLDRPLLRELSLQAPGTWNHSMVIGQMSEAAAEAIGANPLLARVGSYYHDIGKLKKPGYFVENQAGKENRHDKLTPHMSALIIRAHVKDGIEMARQHKLPKAIEDFIPQHHGTSRMEFFYDRAVKEAEAEDGQVVEESRYRYGGPKPQTKEAGILMLADSIEAASRTLSDPTPAKIQGLVQKMINKVFASGELDESELTLRDLHLIAKGFTRVLTGINHKRVEYSEPAEKVSQHRDDASAEAGVQKGGSEGAREKRKSESGDSGKNDSRSASETNGEKKGRDSSAKKGSGGDSKDALKRLGIS